MYELHLAAYFDRIGYDGPVAPTLDMLRSLHRLHPQAIPFENLDPFLHRPVDLDIDAIQQKLVGGNRGGYCFEHNLLFIEVLGAVGFAVTGLAARVIWQQPEDVITARSHMLVRVELDGRTWLADVGFGGLTQTAPLLFEPGLEQPTPHETFRIVATGDHFRLQANTGGEWRSLYRFDLQPQFPVDYAVSNYFLSTNPASRFVTNLLAACAFPEYRLALLNNRLSIRHHDGRTERVEFADAQELAGALTAQFGIDIPDRAAFIEAAQGKLFKPMQ